MTGLARPASLIQFSNSHSRTRPHSRDAKSRPDHAKNLHPRSQEGVGNAGCSLHPQPRVENKNTRVSHHRSAEITRHSRTRMVLTVSFVLSLVIGLSCHHPQVAMREHRHRVDISVEMPGPHDFAVRLKRRPSCAAEASTASPAQRNVTIAKRPSCGPGRGELLKMICPSG